LRLFALYIAFTTTSISITIAITVITVTIIATTTIQMIIIIKTDITPIKPLAPARLMQQSADCSTGASHQNIDLSDTAVLSELVPSGKY